MTLRRVAPILALGGLLALAVNASADHNPQHAVDCALEPAKCATPAGKPQGGLPSVDDALDAAPGQAKVEKPGLLDQIGSALGNAGRALGDAAGAVGRALKDAAGAVGDAIVVALAAIGRGAAAIVAGLVLGVQALLRPLAELLLHWKPKAMPTEEYAAVAAGGVAVASGGIQAGGYLAWRRLAPLLALVPGFSRIAKDELLDHDRRARIFEMIRQNPGTRLSELAHGLDLPWGSCLHHLRKLRADRLITFKAVGHHKCYFVNGSGLNEHEMAAVSVLKGETLQSIAAYLDEHPQVSLKELALGVGISSPLAAFHVGKLERAGLVQKVRDGRSVRLQLANPLPHALLTPAELRAAAPLAPAAA